MQSLYVSVFRCKEFVRVTWVMLQRFTKVTYSRVYFCCIVFLFLLLHLICIYEICSYVNLLLFKNVNG
jgi:hypothetical protein